MAVSSPSSCTHLLLLLLMTSANWPSTLVSAFLEDHVTAPVGPHFTECISRDQATFRCWWSPGTFQNLSSPEAVTVFYLRKDTPTSKWKECPHYIPSSRECYFAREHTSIWVTYCLQLRSQNITYHNLDDCFTVESIVRPDPPVSLNWTLMDVSPSGLNYDVKINWEPPPSAEVRVGWMRIEYEMQYRQRNGSSWESLQIQPHTEQTIYGLQVGKEYEVHIRCRMPAFIKFGEFSNPIFIHVLGRETFPLTVVLVFGIVGILILLLLIVISQQHRFMVILLPPVPVPKIKGIDPELLKKGKLDELNLILSGMGGMSSYAPDFYQDEPWVEFIEVDAEDADAGDKDDNQGSDTQRLLSLPQPSGHHANTGCSNTVGFPDDDSGRASCYDPDVLDQDALMVMATLLPGQLEDREASSDTEEEGGSSSSDKTLVQTQSAGPQTWVNTDFYAQVSNVMPSGGVVLSPGQQHLRIQECGTKSLEEEAQKKVKQSDGEERQRKEMKFQLLVVDPEGSGYTSESTARQIATPPCSPASGEGYHAVLPPPAETKPATPAEDNQAPYIVPDSPQSQFCGPVSDYTVVQEVDTQRSLLLNPPPRQSPPPCAPQHQLKTLPATPVGYITPDLLGNITP